MKLRPAGLVMTCVEVVPVLIEVGRGMVITGSAICCWENGASSVCCWDIAGSWGVGVTEGVAPWMSTGWGVEHGVLVGVGVDGLGVPDSENKEETIEFTCTVPKIIRTARSAQQQHHHVSVTQSLIFNTWVGLNKRCHVQDVFNTPDINIRKKYKLKLWSFVSFIFWLQTQLYSVWNKNYSKDLLCMGESAEGDSRPTWPSSMECFRDRDWLLFGGGVGHFKWPLGACVLYGLPKRKCGDRETPQSCSKKK